MRFHVWTRKQETTYEAMVPWLPGCSVVEPSKEQALETLARRLKEIGREDPEALAHRGWEEYAIEVPTTVREPAQVESDYQHGRPTVQGVRNQIALGGALTVLGISGSIFGLMVGNIVLIALPVLLIMLGMMGMIIGFLGQDTLKPHDGS
ncbi:MAG: hypothetical protein M9921_04660 [Fimbriimonadaceae bacterium]|nr:hypothetical protein [Chthonomonadaceae bacterium]MCO5296128.1 hypothetical protein [Fimbriimonadaceae bacterium]